MKTKPILLALISVFLVGCSPSENKEKEKELAFVQENIDDAAVQLKLMLEDVSKREKRSYPRTMNSKGGLRTTGMYDWTPGFFPGSLWYLYELTGDEYWRDHAKDWTESLEKLQYFTGHHDLGFMVYCSYGNGLRLTGDSTYDDIIYQAAKSLASRYNPNTKTIKSWEYRLAWNDTVEWFYPVIMDNMMNLELLTYASKHNNDSSLMKIALEHSNSTQKNHLRDDFSTYHVVNYDTISGAVLNQGTNQGLSDNSTWARGQAWGIYGFTMMYRETHVEAYLATAEKLANWYIERLPYDLIPYWDFNAGQPGYNPEIKSFATQFQGEYLKDVSAAAIVTSSLFELYEITKKKDYLDYAVKMLHQLASSNYKALPNTNANFILKHSVGSIPHESEIDKPLVYADYYFLEALVRYRNLLLNGSIYKR